MPHSYTPYDPPPSLLLPLSPLSVLSLSLVQRLMTPAPDCGRLKSLQVVSGSHLLLSSLCRLVGVWRGKKGEGVLQELVGVGEGGVSKGRLVSLSPLT